MKLWIKLAYKEIRNNSRFSIFFVINLTLGLVGFIALDSFKISIQEHLERNSKKILTADLSVQSSQPFTAEELTLFAETIPAEATSETIDFYSMVAQNQNSRMIHIIGIDGTFPLYGEIVLNQQGLLKNSPSRPPPFSDKGIWASKDLLRTLGLNEGDTIKIGQESFEIIDTILEAPTTNPFSFLAGIPTVYMGIHQVPETGLVQKGSRMRYERFFKLPEDISLDKVVEDLQQKLEILYPKYEKIRIETHVEEGEDLGRILGYLNDYLGLVALIALFLAGVGGAYLFHNFLVNRFREIAILMSLGAPRKKAYLIVLTQIMILGFFSVVIASLLAFPLLPLFSEILQNFLPKGFVSSMKWSSFFLVFFIGTLGSVICCLPVLTRIYHLHPLALFHEGAVSHQPQAQSKIKQLWSYLPALLMGWALAIWQTRSWTIGSSFIGLFLGSLIVLGLVAWGILAACGKFSHRQKVTPKLALRNLNRNKFGAISSFLAIGLGALLINLIPQIQQGLQEEISQSDQIKVLSFFLFDIQADQVSPLQNTLQETDYQLSHLSPMVHVRLEAVNDETYASYTTNREMTEEEREERDDRFDDDGFNVSYRAELNDSESYVAGKPLSPLYDWQSDTLPEISLEERFAKRLGLEIGDELRFDVQSVPITGKVVNLRKVKWNSFQPNFFIVFQPRVLEEAPKTFLAGISNVATEQKLPLQNKIVQKFPNIMVIDTSRMVSQFLNMMDQISWAIRVMAYLAILAGLVVLFSIARYEVQQRFWEINLLKVLGARFQDVRSIVQIEFGILGLFAAIFGVFLSTGMSFAISYIVFESIWSLSWQMSALSILMITCLSVGTASLATYRLLKEKPLKLLQAD